MKSLQNREITQSRTSGIFIWDPYENPARTGLRKGYGLFRCDSMKRKFILHFITMKILYP